MNFYTPKQAMVSKELLIFSKMIQGSLKIIMKGIDNKFQNGLKIHWTLLSKNFRKLRSMVGWKLQILDVEKAFYTKNYYKQGILKKICTVLTLVN